MRLFWIFLFCIFGLSCQTPSTVPTVPAEPIVATVLAVDIAPAEPMVAIVPADAPAEPVVPLEEDLLTKGERLFLTETFNGNGRTCGTCHRPTENFGLTPAFVSTLPDSDPLFVAETVPALGSNFDNPRLIREFALVVQNQDGFDDLAKNFNLRAVPHTLALRNSVNSENGPRTGWSGDGAPGDGTLRSFATGAVIQYFTKTTDRIAGVDYRLPTDDELDALEAFQLSLGRQQELSLPLPLKGTIAKRGQELFMDRTQGKCNICHFNAGANADYEVFGYENDNMNFNTGVEALVDQPARLTGENVPPDDGFGVPGKGEFNVPTLVEAADTGPFFHNNSVDTLEGAVAFYNSDAFRNSYAAQLMLGATGTAINLDSTQVVEVAAFLRVINALENIRQSIELATTVIATDTTYARATELLNRAYSENQDAIEVLSGGDLHPDVVKRLRAAERALDGARTANRLLRYRLVDTSVTLQNAARLSMIEE